MRERVRENESEWAFDRARAVGINIYVFFKEQAKISWRFPDRPNFSEWGGHTVSEQNTFFRREWIVIIYQIEQSKQFLKQIDGGKGGEFEIQNFVSCCFLRF